jgi:bifunctional NMN adenylyltransferase/nudix hydrolase
MEEKIKNGYGIIAARFQTPYLHEGHLNFINEVLERHDKIILFLGVAKGQPTEKDPLDFETRKLMILEMFPNFTILPIVDNKSNKVWSRELDTRIAEIKGNNKVMLYGSRDSFINSYCGGNPTTEIEPKIILSATPIREKVVDKAIKSQEFRCGVIYGLASRFPSPFITVDVACIDRKNEKVLMAKKPNESGFRFIGGFVDSDDDSIMGAAKRELFEETGGGVEVNSFKLIGEHKIDDWRYKNNKEKIFTMFYTCDYVYGRPVPSDDIEYVEWVDIRKLRASNIEPEHKPLVEILCLELKMPLS